MLAGIEPDRQVSLAKAEAVDVLPVQAFAQAAIFDAGKGRYRRHQVMVPLHRIGREIGNPDQVGFWHEFDGQDTVGIAGPLNAGPVLAVERNAGLIVGPAIGIGRAAAVRDPEGHFAAYPDGWPDYKACVSID